MNKEGWALTCKHVTDNLLAEKPINERYQLFKTKKSEIPKNKSFGRSVQQLAKEFGYNAETAIQVEHQFVRTVADTQATYRVIAHPAVDLALIKFDNFSKLLCDEFPVFPKDPSPLKQGKFLCRLGFPFAEFAHYKFDEDNDSIGFTDSGSSGTPCFPIEGMVTRFLQANGKIIGIELSTPGLKGQSGGPLFDSSGIVWGVQAQTAFLDLDFDKNIEVTRFGKKKPVKDISFLHVGHCIHVDIIKKFMTDNKVSFDER